MKQVKKIFNDDKGDVKGNARYQKYARVLR